MSKPNIEQLIQLGLKIAEFIATKVKSGEWTGRFRKSTKEKLQAQEEALEKLAEAVEAAAEIQAQLYLKITDLERRLQEVENLYMYKG